MGIALLLDTLITILTILGFLVNVYIFISVLLSKQISRPANILIFHMSALFAVLTLFFLALSVPSLLSHPVTELLGHPVCVFHGTLHLIFHPLALWTVAGIHLDRFISIVNPLRYPSILTKKKCTLYLALTWVVVSTLCILPVFGWPAAFKFRPALGLCSPPAYHANPTFAVGYMTISLCAPLCIVTGVNIKITSIAKHHRYRIANALFGMTLGGAAQHMQTEGVRARNQQEKALKHFEGKNAIKTWLQLIGTLHFAYLPSVICMLYETLADVEADPLALKVSLLCLMSAPPINSFLFGIRNKSIQMVLINFMRKEFYKNEVQQEIRLRSPGLASSKRPSMTSIVGQITCQVPYLQRQVSMASLLALNHNGRAASGSTSSASGTLGPKNKRGKPPMVRHSSDLLWRVSSLHTASKICEKDSSRLGQVNRSPSRHSLTVPESTQAILNTNEEPDQEQNRPNSEEEAVSVVTSRFNQLSRNPNGSNIQRNGGRRAHSWDTGEAPLSASGEESSLSEAESENNVFINNHRKKHYSDSIRNSFRSTFNLSYAVKHILQPNPVANKPKITITRVPTIDQTELGFLYPIESSLINEELSTESPPSPIMVYEENEEITVQVEQEPKLMGPHYFDDINVITCKEIFI